ncbi:MAG: hypothetical protein K2H17_10185 [Duncaniella sp.]|uniref:sensor histidine kinase n=1 Tax=Duncaniella sp. TaxID=2518496 RepID=UPI0023CA88EC|nr:tetratricopeptide repeat-containing sensor histidine kinase [Duncaniella sp.]MDE5989753.1 hypothetical protein [Duncaniella sp.]
MKQHDCNLTQILVIIFCQLLFTPLFAADGNTVSSFQRAEDLIGEGKLDEAQQIFDSIFALPDFADDTMYVRVLVEQSSLYMCRGDRKAAKEAALKAVEYIGTGGDQIVYTSLWNNLGVIYNREDNADSALCCYVRALEHANLSADPSWMAAAELNIGMLYFNRKEYEKSLVYFCNAVRNADKADDGYTQLLGSQLHASACLKLGQLDEGEKSIRRAWALALESEDPVLQLRCIPALCTLYDLRNVQDSVAAYIETGDRLLADVPPNSSSATGFVSQKISWLMASEDYKKALPLIRSQMESPMAPPRNELYLLLARCLRALGRTSEAYEMLDSARIWSDTIAARGAARSLAEFDVRYGVMQKELANRQLSNELLRSQRIILWIALSVAVMLIVALLLDSKRRKMKKRLDMERKEKELASSRRYIDGMEEERRYFARELHDGIAADLLAMRMQMDTASAEVTAETADRIRNSVRAISHRLMPPELVDADLAEAMAGYVAMLNHDTEIPGGNRPAIGFVSEGDTSVIRVDKAMELYRIMQEELSNILRHSGASHVDVTLVCKKHFIALEIDHDGTAPPEVDAGVMSKGIGLRTIQDRVKILGAEITRGSVGPTVFTRITIEILSGE